MLEMPFASLTKEEIEERGLNPHDLWLLKFGEEVHGPYEGEALLVFAQDHQDEFEQIPCTRADLNDWRPFFSHAFFGGKAQSTQEKPVTEEYPGPFWIIEQGIKSRPLSKDDIYKKLEMGLIAMTDSISTNDGHEWKRLYETPGFEFSPHSAQDLPKAPNELSFHKAESILSEKFETEIHPHASPKEGIASLTYLTQHQNRNDQLKVDEITIGTVSETEISKSMKWALPAATAAIGAIALIIKASFSPSLPTQELVQEYDTKETPLSILPKNVRPKITNSSRLPASTKPNDLNRRSPLTQDNFDHNDFTTHIETHQNDQVEPDPLQDQINELEHDRTPAQEQSLVGHPTEMLDTVMNPETPAPAEASPEPVVEESSDF